MKRHMFTIAAVASLAICGAVVIFWARSYSDLEALTADDGMRLILASGKGEAAFHFRTCLDAPAESEWQVVRFGAAESAGRLVDTRITRSSPDTMGGAILGAELYVQRVGPPPTLTIIVAVVPYWLLTVATALLPLLYVGARVRRPRCSGNCVKCGYDLRASPHRCPECGSEVQSTATGTIAAAGGRG